MKKNIVIIDDSALMRRVLSDIINSDQMFHVVAVAENGKDALEKMEQIESIDAIVLDLNMPVMSGVEFLRELKNRKIEMQVVLVSTLAKEGGKETMEALELGALDFVRKPDALRDCKGEAFKTRLLKMLTVAVQYNSKSTNKEIPVKAVQKVVKVLKPANLKPKKVHQNTTSHCEKICALACSTGGPKALQYVVPFLPANLDSAVLIVQHMPVGFTASLASRLNDLSAITVKEAEDGEQIEKGVVYIAKGGCHLQVVKAQGGGHRIALTKEPPKDGLRPCANYMYHSLEESDYEKILCVVLTGMGQDGTEGITHLSEKKQLHIISQNEKTCTVYGMPRAIAETGLVDEVLPLQEIAGAIQRQMGVQ